MRVLFPAALVVFAAIAGYFKTLRVPLLFDDMSAIVENPSIRHLWPLRIPLAPPLDCTLGGRPLANLTFALNYAFGGTSVIGYHLVNLGLHVLAAFTLLGVLARTFDLAGVASTPGLFRRTAWAEFPRLPLAITAVWVSHPLLTGSVTYLSQRTEVMMALCYLFSVYAFIRAATGSSRAWWIASVAAVFAGTASKEVMVTAPVVILLYDRTFLTGTFIGAWRRRHVYYASLALSWLLLGFLLVGLQHRDVGFGLGVSWWNYAATECSALVLYLKLVLWPCPLIFDYGTTFPASSWVAASIVASLAVFALFKGLRGGAAGFLMPAFFLLLAPTSSVVPVAGQPIAENRVYLPSAIVLTAAITGLHELVGRRVWIICGIVLPGLVLLTYQRNASYGSAATLWADTVAKRPFNPRAHRNYAGKCAEEGRIDEARQHYLEAIRLMPDYSDAHIDLGALYADAGDLVAAQRHLATAVRLAPANVMAHNNLSDVLLQLGDISGARAHAQMATQLNPRSATAFNHLGNALLREGRPAEAQREYEHALQFNPAFAEAHMNRGAALMLMGMLEEAERCYRRALSYRSDYPEAHCNLGSVLLEMRRFDASRGEFEAGLRLRRNFPEAHHGLGRVLWEQGDLTGARRHFEEALRLRPNYPAAQTNLRRLRAADPRP